MFILKIRTCVHSLSPCQAFFLKSRKIRSKHSLIVRLNHTDLQSSDFQSICALFSKPFCCIARKKKRRFHPPRALHSSKLNRDLPLYTNPLPALGVCGSAPAKPDHAPGRRFHGQLHLLCKKPPYKGRFLPAGRLLNQGFFYRGIV